MHESLSGRGSLSTRAEEPQAYAKWACRDMSVPGAGPVEVSGGRLVASGRGWGQAPLLCPREAPGSPQTVLLRES